MAAVLEAEASGKAVPGFLIHKNCGETNACCLKPLNLGIICVIKIDN